MAADVPKQYLKINGKYILDHTISRFIDIPEIECITIVLAKNDNFWMDSTLLNHSKIKTTIGGKERYHSVLNGLEHIKSNAAPDDWVLVHDAARPCLRPADIRRLIKELQSHEVGGLLAMPTRDTMKRSGENNEIMSTVDRNNLWHALTPQMFKFSDLKNALSKLIDEGIEVTDEAQAIEMPMAEAAVDVDKISDLELVNRIFAERSSRPS